MSERPPIPTGEIAPSLLACDFARLEQQVTTVMDAGARVIHVDVMDGHFVPPITIGSLIVDALRDLVHDRGGILDCHLMVERPERHVEAFAKAGADVITIHPEATPHIHYALKMIREAGVNAGVVINPGTPVEVVEPVADLIDLCLVMSVNPGWGGQRYIPAATARRREAARDAPAGGRARDRRRHLARHDRRGARRRHRPLRRGLERLRRRRSRRRVQGARRQALKKLFPRREENAGRRVSWWLTRNRRGKDGMGGNGNRDWDTTEPYDYYGTARRVFRWTAMDDREAPDALGRASVELADHADAVVHLTGGHADEGLAIRVEE